MIPSKEGLPKLDTPGDALLEKKVIGSGYSVSSWGNYAEALELIKKLREAGIVANITAGGIEIYPEDEKQVKTMEGICQESGHPSHEGTTMHQQDILLGRKKNQ